ncbi:Peptide-methionine (S)-S-oxide reductase [Tulasnella sp. JGI-2019a]|nr:Peptide-methionine (S)-S-oxide reductase [Tulasnella sp. JGI-2019a]
MREGAQNSRLSIGHWVIAVAVAVLIGGLISQAHRSTPPASSSSPSFIAIMLGRLSGFLNASRPSQTAMSGSVIPTVATALASYEVTSKNTESSGKVEVATFANGCFWGTQHLFDHYYGPKGGVIKTDVGYIGGNDKFKNPTYNQVCSGTTGYAEACKVEFDPERVGYAELVEFFYRSHDPTTVDRQGADKGTQYRSVIFTQSLEQAEIAKKVTAEVDEKYFKPKGQRIVTGIESAPTWYTAEAYHQVHISPYI